MRAPIRASAAFLFTLGVVACDGGDPTGDDAPDGGVPLTTWYRDIGPMLAEHCMECHQPGGIAPFSLTEYEDASEIANQLLEAVETGLMPPWDAEPGADCTPNYDWKQDPRLSVAQTDLLRKWIADGRPAGEPAALPPPPDTTLQGVTTTVAPSTPYVTAGTADEFMCFILEPQFTGPVKWITGSQVRPGNADVVHHVVTTAMQPGPALDALKAANGVGRAFDCAAGGTPDESYFVSLWTPGNQPMVTPDTMALPLLQGSALVMQIHYHPAGQVNAPDATSVDLRLTDTAPEKMWTMLPVGNAFEAPTLLAGPNDPGGIAQFYIPPGAADHSEHMRFTIDNLGTSEIPLFAAYPHMHYIGVGLQVRLERANPRAGEDATECLINVPRWNFDWQRAYLYDAPFTQLPIVRQGDVLDVRCTYDNTLDNPFVQRALQEEGLSQPIEVRLGEETLDEMCLGIFGAVFDAPNGDMTSLPPPPEMFSSGPRTGTRGATPVTTVR